MIEKLKFKLCVFDYGSVWWGLGLIKREFLKKVRLTFCESRMSSSVSSVNEGFQILAISGQHTYGYIKCKPWI